MLPGPGAAHIRIMTEQFKPSRSANHNLQTGETGANRYHRTQSDAEGVDLSFDQPAQEKPFSLRARTYPAYDGRRDGDIRMDALRNPDNTGAQLTDYLRRELKKDDSLYKDEAKMIAVSHRYADAKTIDIATSGTFMGGLRDKVITHVNTSIPTLLRFTREGLEEYERCSELYRTVPETDPDRERVVLQAERRATTHLAKVYRELETRRIPGFAWGESAQHFEQATETLNEWIAARS